MSAMAGEESGATRIASGIITYLPGCSNATHYHNTEESPTVLEREGVLVTEGEEHQVKPHDATLVTSGTHDGIIDTRDRPFNLAWSYATVHVSLTPVE